MLHHKQKYASQYWAQATLAGNVASKLLVKCARSNTKLLPSEARKCSVTGKRVDARLLKTCAVSGKNALASEMVECNASGKWILPQYTKKLPNGAVVGIKNCPKRSSK